MLGLFDCQTKTKSYIQKKLYGKIVYKGFERIAKIKVKKFLLRYRNNLKGNIAGIKIKKGLSITNR